MSHVSLSTTRRGTHSRNLRSSELYGPSKPQTMSSMSLRRSYGPHAKISCAAPSQGKMFACIHNKPLRRHAVQVQASATVAAATTHETPLRVMIAGAPAAGKGTQCARIVEKYGLFHISVGDLLRAEVTAETPAGKRAKAFMDAGDLVPNDVVVEMVKNKLADPRVKKSGWLLDGYPRSGEQAEAIEAEGIRPDVFLLINVPDEMLVERVVGRRSDPETGEIYHLKFKPPPEDVVPRLVQRSDDTEEKCRARLDTYYAHVDAVVGYYKDVLVEINGERSMDDVFQSISEVLDDAQKKRTAAGAS